MGLSSSDFKDARRASLQHQGEDAGEVSGGASAPPVDAGGGCGGGAPGDVPGAWGAGAVCGGAAGAGAAGSSLCGRNEISSICQRPTGCEMVRSMSAYLAA